MSLKANTYFSELLGLLQNVEVTDSKKASVPLELGVEKVAEQIRGIRANSGKVMVVGNGGSAAIANHMHNDLCKAIKVRALTFYESPLLTAYANDDGYESAFEQAVNLWADEGDLLVSISSSGQSENILRAVKQALKRGCLITTLTGFEVANPLRQLGHYNFYVASSEYGLVESAHANLTHCITDTLLYADHRQS